MKNDNELFPMLDGPPITWGTARVVYKLYGSGQSLERIAERGGFGWAEVKLMSDEYRRFKGHAAYNKLLSVKGTD